MRLYSRNGATAATHDGVDYEPQDDGGFDFPDHIAEYLATFPHWETHTQRSQRLAGEDLARRRDPASQYDELAKLRDLLAPDPEVVALRARVAEMEAAEAARAAKSRARRPAAKQADGDGDPDAT